MDFQYDGNGNVFDCCILLIRLTLNCSCCNHRAPLVPHHFTIGLPFPPWTPSFTVQQYGISNIFLTVQWQPLQYDGGAPVNYTITVSPGFSPLTASTTSSLIPRLSLLMFHPNLSESATNSMLGSLCAAT